MDSDNHWHLDKRVNLGHLIATLILAGSVFAWGNGIDQRVTRLESQQQSQAERLDRIYVALQQVNNKLDELNQYLRDNAGKGK